MTSKTLRDRYPVFQFESFSYTLPQENTAQELTVIYSYVLGEHRFSHTVVFEHVRPQDVSTIPDKDIRRYLLTIGLAEMLNYWKLTASPTIRISAGALPASELDWWHTLLMHGMGEYFFVNDIDFSSPTFVRFTADTLQEPDLPLLPLTQPKDTNTPPKILIPIGGGKDSAVTLQLFSQAFPNTTAGFMVNPIQSAEDTLAASSVPTAVTIHRQIDPLLLELNAQGYLNGHVPISSVLACMSVFAARLFGYTHIAISNERSSNEGNVFYCNQEINHQYSKTATFETSFAQYCATYLPANTPEYFSFLRPLYELQIAQRFAQMPQYHSVFRSCNRGQKQNAWCGNCPKCLFAYSMLVPFLGSETTARHFGKDLFADATLYPLAEELLGVGEKKPLECVGTYEETLCAFYLATQQYQEQNTQLPALLARVTKEILSTQVDLAARAATILSSWNSAHRIPPNLVPLLEENKQHG